MLPTLAAIFNILNFKKPFIKYIIRLSVNRVCTTFLLRAEKYVCCCALLHMLSQENEKHFFFEWVNNKS